jgi:hypothetical protein
MKGQLAGQVFMYILGIIVVGIILLVGLRGLNTVQENQCKVQYTQFVTELSGEIEKNKKWGTNKYVDIRLPCDVEQVCFVSRTVVDTVPSGDVTADEALISGISPLVSSGIADGVNINVFLRTKDGIEGVERFATPAPLALPTDDPFRCIGRDGIARIHFKGQGQLVEVADAGSS